MNEGMPQGDMGGAAGQQGQAQSSGTSGMGSNPGGMKKDVHGLIGQLEALLDEYMVKKAPFTLPMGLKEFIAKVSPYLIIIFAVLSLPLILTAIGISTAFAPLGMMGYGGYGHMYGFGWGFGAIISLVVAVIVLVMEVLAVPGLFKRTKAAWRLIFYASIVSLIGSILSVSGIVGGVVGAIIGWYILFQVKELYKN